ncbi:MAG: endonuclease [Rhodanobacter sp. SCN 67-45]|nr:MAG: endonuclease [Rhodanobacter sp. SCN 67-45]
MFACALAVGVSVTASAGTTPLRVMTFNVRVPVDQGANAWENRRGLMVQVIRARQGREGGSKGEHMGVFYRTDRLEVLRFGDFWLSDTPDVPGSITWGQPYPRMVTWARFRLRDGGGTFDYLNTHFPYRDQDVRPRMLSAAEILRWIDQLPADARVILTGDFNCAPDTPVHAKLTAGLHDAWIEAATRSGPARTFHNFTGTPDRRIDWILSRGFKARTVSTVTTHEGARYPSDHFPVVAELVATPAAVQ